MEDNEEVSNYVRSMVKETMKRMSHEVPEGEKGKYEDLMIKIIAQGVSPKEALEVGDELLEHLYEHGYNLYINGNYKKAQQIFRSLLAFQPTDPRLYLGKGACAQRLGEWEEAVEAYYTCAEIDRDSPMPYFYLYECLNQLKRYHEAATCLGEVIARCADLELFSTIKERSLLLLQNIPESVKAEEKVEETQEIKQGE